MPRPVPGAGAATCRTPSGRTRITPTGTCRSASAPPWRVHRAAQSASVVLRVERPRLDRSRTPRRTSSVCTKSSSRLTSSGAHAVGWSARSGRDAVHELLRTRRASAGSSASRSIADSARPDSGRHDEREARRPGACSRSTTCAARWRACQPSHRVGASGATALRASASCSRSIVCHGMPHARTGPGHGPVCGGCGGPAREKLAGIPTRRPRKVLSCPRQPRTAIDGAHRFGAAPRDAAHLARACGRTRAPTSTAVGTSALFGVPDRRRQPGARHDHRRGRRPGDRGRAGRAGTDLVGGRGDRARRGLARASRSRCGASSRAAASP